MGHNSVYDHYLETRLEKDSKLMDKIWYDQRMKLTQNYKLLFRDKIK